MRRLTLCAAWLLGLASLGGVEGEQTYTLNPDGSGKVKIDVVTAAPIDPFGAGGSPKEETIKSSARRSSASRCSARSATRTSSTRSRRPITTACKPCS